MRHLRTPSALCPDWLLEENRAILLARIGRLEMNKWLVLGIAIVAETIATSALKSSEGFTKVWPSVIVLVGYAVAFYFLSLTLRTIPVGIAYAIWSGVGIVLITLAGWLVFGQKLDAPALIGMALIIAGVVIMNVFSSAGH
jgi:multidrug transporter EmrE-like cation transporter